MGVVVAAGLVAPTAVAGLLSTTNAPSRATLATPCRILGMWSFPRLVRLLGLRAVGGKVSIGDEQGPTSTLILALITETFGYCKLSPRTVSDLNPRVAPSLGAVVGV